MIYLELLWTFFKIGLFTFGGGYAMLPLVTSEVVLKKSWISESELTDFVAISESTPGPFAINLATYVGASTAESSLLGAICSTFGVVMPSFIVILVIALFYSKFKNNKYVDGAMRGLRPAAVGMIASAAVTLAGGILFPAGVTLSVDTLCTAVIFALSMLLIFFGKKSPISVIGFSAVAGIVIGFARSFF